MANNFLATKKILNNLRDYNSVSIIRYHIVEFKNYLLG